MVNIFAKCRDPLVKFNLGLSCPSEKLVRKHVEFLLDL